MNNSKPEPKCLPDRSRGNDPYVCIHIGMPKTATTMLQSCVFPNHSELFPLGKVPQLAPDRYPLEATRELVEVFESPFNQLSLETATELRSVTKSAAREGKLSVLSKEGLSGSPPEKKRRVARILKETFENCKILMTIREPESFMESLYFQHLKAYQKGKCRGMQAHFGPPPRYFTINEWFEVINKGPRNVETHLRYAETATFFAEEFGKENVKILIFEQLKCDPEGFMQELCGFLGINAEEGFLLSKNRSANVRWDESEVQRLKSMDRSLWRRLRYRFAGHKTGVKMLGIDKNHQDHMSKTRAASGMNAHIKNRIAELSGDQIKVLETEWGLPLSDYGYSC